MWVTYFLGGFLAFIVGFTFMIKPLKRLKISRKVGAIVMVVGLVVGGVGAADGWLEYTQEKFVNEAGYATVEEYVEAKAVEKANEAGYATVEEYLEAEREKIAAEKAEAKEIQDAAAWLDCGSAANEEINKSCRSVMTDQYDLAGFSHCKDERIFQLCGAKPSEEAIDKVVSGRPNPYTEWAVRFRIGQEKCKAKGLDIINDNKAYMACATAYAGPRPHEQ